MARATSHDLLLSEQACFALYAASRAVTERYRPLLAELDLTYPQYLVLLVLWESDDRPIREIGQALHLDYGTLSPLLKRLEARGLLTRNRGTDDERSVRIGLTEHGRALRERATGIPPVLGCAMGLSDADRRELITTLHALTASVRADGTGEPSP